MKVINDQSVQRMERSLEERQRLEAALAEQRSRYKWWAELFANPDEQQRLLDGIRKKGEALKAELAALPAYPTLREHASKNEQDCTDALLLIIVWLGEQINVPGMSEAQMRTMAVDILSAYGTFRLEDVLICFRTALRGGYGTIYNRLDMAVLHEWLGKYKAELERERAGKAESVRASNK